MIAFFVWLTCLAASTFIIFYVIYKYDEDDEEHYLDLIEKHSKRIGDD